MKRIKSLVFVFCLLAGCHNKEPHLEDRLYVYIKPYDCASCNLGVQTLQNLQVEQRINTVLLFRRIRKKEATQLTSGYNYPVEVDEDKVSRFIEKGWMKDESTVILIRKGKAVFSCSLKHIYTHISALKNKLNSS